jgi:hypothetical protein
MDPPNTSLDAMGYNENEIALRQTTTPLMSLAGSRIGEPVAFRLG